MRKIEKEKKEKQSIFIYQNYIQKAYIKIYIYIYIYNNFMHAYEIYETRTYATLYNNPHT